MSQQSGRGSTRRTIRDCDRQRSYRVNVDSESESGVLNVEKQEMTHDPNMLSSVNEFNSRQPAKF